MREFAVKYRLATAGRYNDVREICVDSDVDAINIATPAHAEIAVMAMRCGKHVLCEKPAAVIATQITAMTEVAGQQGIFLTEGLMYCCHPQIEHMLEIIRTGEIGAINLPIDDVSQCQLSQLPLGPMHSSSISALRTFEASTEDVRMGFLGGKRAFAAPATNEPSCTEPDNCTFRKSQSTSYGIG